MCNKAVISWESSGKTDSADMYVLQYRKRSREEESMMWQEVEVYNKSKGISDLDDDSSYTFRVRGYKGSICSSWSKEVILRTPPAPGTGFSSVHLHWKPPTVPRLLSHYWLYLYV